MATDWAIIVPVIITFLGTVGIWIKAYYDYKKKRAGNNPHPCGQHDERLRELEKSVAGFKEAISDLKEDVKRIENKLNGIR